MKNKAIGFIGLGKLGLPIAETIGSKYLVKGYDIKHIQSNIITCCESIKEIIDSCNLIFVAVQTPHHPDYGGEIANSHLPKKDFSYSILENVIEEINKYSNEDHTIVIISTVLPGTTRKILKPLLTNSTLIYNPYLIAMGTVKNDFLNPEMIIIGSENSHNQDEDLIELKEFYLTLVDKNTRFEIGTWEEAESIKIFYNTFISAKIAIVNMIQDISEKLGNINSDVVTQALSRSTKRIISSAYMKSGMGDGGPCHPRDNIALSWLSNKLNLGYDLFESINVSREIQAKNMALRLNSFNLPIVILGTNYKPNTTLRDGSYALLVSNYLIESNSIVYLDTNPDNYSKFVYLLCHENIYNDFDFNLNSVIFDPWRSFKTERDDLIVISYGNTRE